MNHRVDEKIKSLMDMRLEVEGLREVGTSLGMDTRRLGQASRVFEEAAELVRNAEW